MPIGLVLADDHPLILDALENLFRAEPDFRVLARCRDGQETLAAVRAFAPDVLILDIRMPGMDGMAVLREMKKEGLVTQVVLLTAALDEDQLLEAVRLGVRGVILKEMAPTLLLECVRKVRAGEQWVEKHSFSRALEKLLRREAAAREFSGVLTAREAQLVVMVAGGARNKEIADTLCISEGTVKVHLHHIYEKLKVRTRLELTLYARDKGLI